MTSYFFVSSFACLLELSQIHPFQEKVCIFLDHLKHNFFRQLVALLQHIVQYQFSYLQQLFGCFPLFLYLFPLLFHIFLCP